MTDARARLDIQHLDNELDQLRYSREHLPERAALAELAAAEASLAAAVATTEANRDELRRKQRQLEDEAADVEAKATQLEGRLYDGSVTSPKEASAISDEISALKSRQSILEDQAIELLIEIEPLDRQFDNAATVAAEQASSRNDLESSLGAAEAAIAADTERTEGSRAAAAATVEPAQLELYRKMRITYGPDAVVEFDPSRGGGCPIAMSAVELDRWKHLPVGTLGPCTDCGRLVAKLS